MDCIQSEYATQFYGRIIMRSLDKKKFGIYENDSEYAKDHKKRIPNSTEPKTEFRRTIRNPSSFTPNAELFRNKPQESRSDRLNGYLKSLKRLPNI